MLKCIEGEQKTIQIRAKYAGRVDSNCSIESLSTAEKAEQNIESATLKKIEIALINNQAIHNF